MRKALAALVASLVLLAPPALAGGAECAGDECQGPAPAPAEIVPGTAVAEGPPNPPVHYPKVRKHHKKKSHPKHQRQRGSR